MKYVNFTLQEMTPEQLKQNPITVHPNQKLDTEEGQSNTDEQESTISNKEKEESSTFSDMSKQDSESDINVDDTQDQENPQTPETLQIHYVYNTRMHDRDDLIYDEYDTSEDENITEMETYEHYGEKIHETEESKPTETSQVLTVGPHKLVALLQLPLPSSVWYLNKQISNQKVYLSEQSVNECDLSLLLKIDSRHQQ